MSAYEQKPAKCWCSPCELARFRGWLDRVEAIQDLDGDDDRPAYGDEGDPRRPIALEILADISDGREPQGIAEVLACVVAQLMGLGGDVCGAESDLLDLVEDEERSQELNEDERVCPLAAKGTGARTTA